jgi:hypothetical protein
MLSMLIPGPKSLKMDIDVYLFKQGMQGQGRILHSMLFFYGQLMTSQLMQCLLVRARKGSLHVHIATKILSICG